MELGLFERVDRLIQSKQGNKLVGGKDLYLFEENGKKRTIEVTGSGKFMTFYTFDESKISICDEEKFYQAINSINEQMNSLSVEYFPDDEALKIKSSLLVVQGINIEESIRYFFGMHDKYFSGIYEGLAGVNSSTNIIDFGKIVKESISKRV